MSNRVPAVTRLWLILSVALIVQLAAGTIVAQENPDAPVRVLFVGNSYTYYNNLGAMVEAIGLGSRPSTRIEASLAVRGGATLASLLSDERIQQWVSSSKWDWIVLQEQSQLGVGYDDGPAKLGSPENFHKSVRRWVRRIGQTGAKPLLFMTWARRDFPEQMEQLAGAYTTIGNDLNVAVAPIGIAWNTAKKELAGISLYIDDGSHPSAAGSYLAACVLVSAIVGANPAGAPARIVGQSFTSQAAPDKRDAVLVDLPREVALRLQKIAWESVRPLAR